jgi:hypothetical protein
MQGWLNHPLRGGQTTPRPKGVAATPRPASLGVAGPNPKSHKKKKKKREGVLAYGDGQTTPLAMGVLSHPQIDHTHTHIKKKKRRRIWLMTMGWLNHCNTPIKTHILIR